MSLMAKLSPRRGDDGFTLLETMAALVVFSIVTIGLIPLFASSMRGSTLARSYTVGKNIAIDGMERVRGLPFFISYASRNKRVDVLDLYFPNLNAGYSGNTFTTTCTATTVNPACPPNIPAGLTVTYKATFVRTSTFSTSPTRYDVLTPPAGYRWDSATGADIPPSQLLEMLVRTTWDVGGETKDYELKTLIGDRKVGTTRLRGTSRVDYGLQVLTGYDVLGTKSSLNFNGASAESKVETKLLSTASQSAHAAMLTLLRSPLDSTALGTDIGDSPVSGASTSLVAPPDTTPLGDSVGAVTLAHPDWTDASGAAQPVGFLEQTNTSTLRAATANELPSASGQAKIGGSNDPVAWINNQADRSQSSSTVLQFHDSAPMFELGRLTRALQADTSATTTASTAADRKVETIAQAELGDVRLMPTSYQPADPKYAIRISDFRATATCKATANPSTAVASGSWTATLRYWKDTNPADNIASGSLQSVSLNSATLGTTLADLQAQNPLVYDHSSTGKDVYLFKTGTVNGYLSTWQAVAPVANKSADGRSTTVNIDGAIRIDTAPTNPLIPESAMSISLGKLYCEAVDNR